jgi:hypothetical protein
MHIQSIFIVASLEKISHDQQLASDSHKKSQNAHKNPLDQTYKKLSMTNCKAKFEDTASSRVSFKLGFCNKDHMSRRIYSCLLKVSANKSPEVSDTYRTNSGI